MGRTVQWQHEHDRSRSTTTASASGTSSARSYDTAPTRDTHNSSSHRRNHSENNNNSSSSNAVRPAALARNGTCLGRMQGNAIADADAASSLASVDTYASTSEEDLADDDDEDDVNALPEFAVPHYVHDHPLPVDAIPTTPRDFADLFPTSKRIAIRHDDSTIDGNMNLRVDTQVEETRGTKQNYTLFHLRMHDLRTRDFSLRRYCRDSGREVCHSIRKYQPPPEKRPVLQRASTALASLRHKPDSRPSTAAGLKRSDSGYESIRGMANDVDRDDDEDNAPGSRKQSVAYSKGRALLPTNTLKLEFSNYAHIDVKRRGTSNSKRYTFEYWGRNYAWKRIVKQEQPQDSVSYYLVRSDNEREPLAHICPVRLSPQQMHEEAARGGWIPPCYMRITDEATLRADSDISDVVVATGLMALVDDCIKRRFHAKPSTQLHMPLLLGKMHIDYIGPKRLIDEMFNRHSRTGPPSRQPSALRRPATQG